MTDINKFAASFKDAAIDELENLRIKEAKEKRLKSEKEVKDKKAEKLASVIASFHKKAQEVTLADTQRATQSMSVIAGSSDKLYKDVDTYVNAKMMLPDAKTRVTNIRKLAAGLLAISKNQTISWLEVEGMANNVRNAYKEFEQNYMPVQWVRKHRYSPMIDLGNALDSLFNFLSKVDKSPAIKEIS